MSDTRYASIDPRSAECRHPDRGFRLPTVAEIYHADQSTMPTDHAGEIRISTAVSAAAADPDLTRSQQADVLAWIYRAWEALAPHETGALLEAAQDLYLGAAELHDLLQRALDTLDVEERLSALASAQFTEETLEGVDVVEAVGEQLITEIREQEEPETW